MSVMVTGGTGFIGNRIIRKLVERGEDVVCFDLAPPRANMQPLLDRISVYRGDVTPPGPPSRSRQPPRR